MRLLPLLAVLLTGFAPAPFPKHEPRHPTDLTRLQGEWEVVEIADSNGRTKLSEEGTSITFIVKSNVVVVRLAEKGMRGDFEGRMTIDPEAVPKQVTWRLASAGVGEKLESVKDDVKLLGIYRLFGNDLTICAANGKEQKRPAGFDVSVSSTNALIVCRRKRP
jgi:uncharacterized protein (TIGR03067 family)